MSSKRNNALSVMPRVSILVAILMIIVGLIGPNTNPVFTVFLNAGYVLAIALVIFTMIMQALASIRWQKSHYQSSDCSATSGTWVNFLEEQPPHGISVDMRVIVSQGQNTEMKAPCQSEENEIIISIDSGSTVEWFKTEGASQSEY